MQSRERGRGTGGSGEGDLAEEFQAVVFDHVVEAEVGVAAAAKVVMVVGCEGRIDALSAEVVSQGGEPDVHAGEGVAEVSADGA